LLARLKPPDSSAAPAWPQLEGTVKADSLILGPVTLTDATGALHILPTGAEITGLNADLLGGRIHGTGTIHPASGDRDKPAYTFEATLEKLDPEAVGDLADSHWRGGELNADGKVELSGFTEEDLVSSAHGTVHLDWKRGSVMPEREGDATPGELAHFDRWTADAEIANGAITLKDNVITLGSRKGAIKGAVTGALAFGDPATLTLVGAKETQAKRGTQAKR